MGQLSLFGGAVEEPRRGPVGPAEVGPSVTLTAQRLPPELRLGTSSWSFPGWHGLVYDREVGVDHLAKHGLEAYAQHPLFGTVGVDRTYYAPVGREVFEDYAAAVPEGFRFLVKAHEGVVVPEGTRARPRDVNPDFLDPGYAIERVVRPFVEGLGGKAGPLLFQFPPLDLRKVGGAARFVERLHGFLGGLPRGPHYAVEVRSAALIGHPDYPAALRDVGVGHCLSAHPSLPPVGEQVARLGPVLGPALGPGLVVRWMLAPHLRYEAARERYAPFDALVDPDPDTRGAIARQAWAALASGRAAFVVVNNKAEGSSPLSIVRLAEEVVAQA